MSVSVSSTIPSTSSYRPAYDAADPKATLPGLVKNYDANPTKLFSPLKIRDVTLKNRHVVAPMCQYSSEDGFANDHHFRHYTTLGVGGAGLVIFEATAVAANGRITPQCLGLWKDEHIAPLKRIVDYLHVHNVTAGIQIGHAGRKASAYAPFQGSNRDEVKDGKFTAIGTIRLDDVAPESRGGWPTQVVGPSNVPFDTTSAQPNALTIDQIKSYQQAFVATAKRADAAGFDVLEIHGAHGYLISEFLSPLVNTRTDIYGGSFENRIRFLVEIVQLVRTAWPASKPLFVRVSSTDWAVENGWTPDETVALAKVLLPLGVDVMDLSSGGNLPFGVPNNALTPAVIGVGYQVPFAERVKKEVPGMISMAVGLIHTATQAEGFLQAGAADLIAVGRDFLRNPYLTQFWAQELNVELTYNAQTNVWVGFHARKTEAPVTAAAATATATAATAVAAK